MKKGTYAEHHFLAIQISHFLCFKRATWRCHCRAALAVLDRKIRLLNQFTRCTLQHKGTRELWDVVEQQQNLPCASMLRHKAHYVDLSNKSPFPQSQPNLLHRGNVRI